MATITPSWTDSGTELIASASLARESSTSATLDCRSKWGARLLIRLARTGTTALSGGGNSGAVVARVRPAPNNNAIAHPGDVWAARSQIAAASSSTVDTDSNSGQKVLNIASTTGFAEGDTICIGHGTARQEWARVAEVIDATTLELDRNLTSTHTAVQADTVLNKADCWTVDVGSGAVWEVVLDYGGATAGEAVRVQVLQQTFDSVSSA